MKGLSRNIIPLLLIAIFVTGCGRKEEEPVAQAESPTPPEIEAVVESAPSADSPVTADPAIAGTAPLPPTSPSLESAAAPVVAPDAAAPASAPTPTDGAPAAPQNFAASDAAYEAWFRKYSLNLNDPNMLDADPDGDGVKNRDEFMADTNPVVADSRPGFHKTMRLKQFSEVRLPLMLEGVDGNKARIKRLDETSARVETVKTGDSLRGLPFKVANVRSQRGTDKAGEKVDSSRVTLEDPVTREQTVLVKDMPARSSASHAVLVAADGSSTITVRMGDIFSWPTDPGVNYRVIDLRADQAVIEEVETGKTVTVPKK